MLTEFKDEVIEYFTIFPTLINNSKFSLDKQFADDLLKFSREMKAYMIGGQLKLVARKEEVLLNT
jgi:hypothetical protein